MGFLVKVPQSLLQQSVVVSLDSKVTVRNTPTYNKTLQADYVVLGNCVTVIHAS